MSDPVQVLERVRRVCPFGVRFWDAVAGSVVSDGLMVTVYPTGNPARRVPAFPNRMGVYAVHRLPGIPVFEDEAGDASFWTTTRPFVVEVTDGAGRFLPFRFDANLSVRNLFRWEVAPPALPPEAVPFVPLYSAPARAVPAAMAVIRADLQDLHAGAPAAWAVLEARLPGQPPAHGIADEKGRVVVILPYPEPPVGPGSPLDAAGAPLAGRQWTVEFHARYQPAGAAGDPGEEWTCSTHPHLRRPAPGPCPICGLRLIPAIPRLRTTLLQGPATLWRELSPPQPLTEATLRFGRELVLPPLWITPAGSPP